MQLTNITKLIQTYIESSSQQLCDSNQPMVQVSWKTDSGHSTNLYPQSLLTKQPGGINLVCALKDICVHSSSEILQMMVPHDHLLLQVHATMNHTRKTHSATLIRLQNHRSKRKAADTWPPRQNRGSSNPKLTSTNYWIFCSNSHKTFSVLHHHMYTIIASVSHNHLYTTISVPFPILPLSAPFIQRNPNPCNRQLIPTTTAPTTCSSAGLNLKINTRKGPIPTNFI